MGKGIERVLIPLLKVCEMIASPERSQAGPRFGAGAHYTQIDSERDRGTTKGQSSLKDPVQQVARHIKRDRLCRQGLDSDSPEKPNRGFHRNPLGYPKDYESKTDIST
jgi:hypothetical protein